MRRAWSWIINLLSKEQFRAAGPEALWGGLAASATPTTTGEKVKIIATYCFWSAGDDVLPTARQVRLTLDEIDEAHAVNQIVFVSGAGYPARAAMAAGCWLARHRSRPDEKEADVQTARLGWLERAGGSLGQPTAAWTLDEDERAFVCAWPAGPGGEPVLTSLELLDEEVYPTATVEYWLRTLPTVRVYPEGRAGRRVEVPVQDEKRVSNGSINLELYDLHSGTWVGERTLKLLDGTVVVFVSPFKKRSS